MTKIILLLMFTFPVFAVEDDGGGKMSPEELREYNLRQSNEHPEPMLYPEVMPLNLPFSSIAIYRGDDCYQNYMHLISVVYDACAFIQKRGFNTAYRALQAINDGFNKHPVSGLTLTIMNKLDLSATAMVMFGDREQARRRRNGGNGRGSHSVMVLGSSYYRKNSTKAGAIFAHEVGHTYRGQIGYASRVEGALISVDGSFFRPLGWWREEMQNIGLIPSGHSFATENSFRREVGLPEAISYNRRMTAGIFRDAESFYQQARGVRPGLIMKIGCFYICYRQQDLHWDN